MDKKLLQSSLIYVLLGFMAPALNFILLPLYAHYFTKLDFSILTLSVLVQGFFTNIMGGGLNGAFSRFYFEYKESKETDNLFFTTLNVLLIVLVGWLTLLFLSGNFLFGFIFSNEEFTFTKFGWLSIVLAGLANIQQLILNKYRNDEKPIYFALFSIATFLTPALFIYIGVVTLKGGALYSLYGRTLGMGIIILIYIIIYYVRNKISFKKEYIKRMGEYSRNIMFYVMLTFLAANIDKYLVERKFDFIQLGMYGMGANFIYIVDIFVSAMNNAVKPRIFSLMKIIDQPGSVEQLRNLNRFYLILLSVIWLSLLLLFSFGNFVFLNNIYVELNYFFPLMLLAMINRIYYVVYLDPILFHMQTQLLPKIMAVSVLFSALGSFLLIPVMGIWAVILMLVLTGFLQMSLVIFLSKRRNIMNMEAYYFPKEKVLYIFAALTSVLLSLNFYFNPTQHPYLVNGIFIPLVILGYAILYGKEIKTQLPTLLSALKKKQL